MIDRTMPSDYRVDVGRADGGRTFVRVLHIPTGKERIRVGLVGANPNEVTSQLTQEIANEIDAENLDSNPPPDLQEGRRKGPDSHDRDMPKPGPAKTRI